MKCRHCCMYYLFVVSDIEKKGERWYNKEHERGDIRKRNRMSRRRGKWLWVTIKDCTCRRFPPTD